MYTLEIVNYAQTEIKTPKPKKTITREFGMLHDSQRSKVYKAETVLKKFATPLPTVRDIENYIQWLSNKAVVQRHYRFELARAIHVGDGRGRRRPGGDQDGIIMPSWSRVNWIVIHELAHTISMRRHGRRNIAGHGWEYCAIYLDLVRIAMGQEAHDALKDSFKKAKVKFRAPTKRGPKNLTEEQKEVLKQRLAEARAIRAKKLNSG